MSDYILVTNFWNEAGNIRPAIENIAQQAKPPREWFFIDDGSPEEAGDKAHSEIMKAGDEFGIKTHYWYVFPMKANGDKYNIGKAWNVVIGVLKELKTDYLGVADLDTRFPSDYFEIMVECLDTRPHVGAVAGRMVGEKRYQHMPMGGGKLVRWEIFEDIEEFWNFVPDTFLNIKSLAKGFKNAVLEVVVEGRKSTPRYGRELGYRLYYCGNSVVTALFKTLRLRDFGVIKGFLASRGKEQCTDPDVRYYYSKKRILKSAFRGKVWML